MKRLTLIAAVVVVAVALLVTAAVAQGWGRGGGGRWTNISPQDTQRVTDLHQKVRQAQWDLWTLQSQKADPKKMEQKTNEVLRLRGELAKLMTNLPAGPCFQATQGNTTPPQGIGIGRGPCGLGMGFGRGGARGMGRGGGRGGPGMCWRWQQTQPQPPAQ